MKEAKEFGDAFLLSIIRKKDNKMVESIEPQYKVIIEHFLEPEDAVRHIDNVDAIDAQLTHSAEALVRESLKIKLKEIGWTESLIEV